MRRPLGFPQMPRVGQAQVFDGLAWVFSAVAALGGGVALTPTRIPVMGSGGLVDSHLIEALTGAGTISYSGTLTGSRVRTMQDASGTEALLEVAQIFTAQQFIHAAGGIVVRQATTQDAIAIVGNGVGSSSRSITVTGPASPLTASRTQRLIDADLILAGSAALLTSGRVPVVTTGGLLTSFAGLTYSTNFLTLGDGTTASVFTLNGLVATQRSVFWQTAAVNRWRLMADTDAEPGSDAGSTLKLTAFTDAGGAVGDIWTITRASGGAFAIARVTTITGVAPAAYTAARTDIGGGRILTSELYIGDLPRLFSANGGVTPTAQIAGVNAAGSSLSLARYGNSALGPYAVLAHSRGATINSHVIVATGDTLGSVAFDGSDGTQFQEAGRIEVLAGTGTPSTTSMPGAMRFSVTADGAIIPTQRMLIVPSGEVGIGNSFTPTAGAGLLQFSAGTTIANGIAMNSCGIFANAANALTINATAGLTTTGGRLVKTRSVVSAAGTTTLDGTDHAAVLTGTTTQTFTLPAAVAGRQLYIKNRSTAALTVNRAGSDTIDGLTTLNVAAGVGNLLVANGTDWVVI